MLLVPQTICLHTILQNAALEHLARSHGGIRSHGIISQRNKYIGDRRGILNHILFVCWHTHIQTREVDDCSRGGIVFGFQKIRRRCLYERSRDALTGVGRVWGVVYHVERKAHAGNVAVYKSHLQKLNPYVSGAYNYDSATVRFKHLFL